MLEVNFSGNLELILLFLSCALDEEEVGECRKIVTIEENYYYCNCVLLL